MASEAVDAPSKVHLFIFDSESQEDSQSIIGDHPVAPSKPRAAVHTDAVLSLTQVQLDEDKQRIKELMSQTNQVSSRGLRQVLFVWLYSLRFVELASPQTNATAIFCSRTWSV